MSRVILLHRWKKGYEAFIQKDYSVAFSMFELIEMTFIDKSSIPKEIIMNRILCLIALKNYAHAVEVGSKLLRSELGSFFLFAVGLHQEKVNKELAFSSFKKCLLSLGSSKAKQFPESSWMLTKFMVLINLAITSASMRDAIAAESFLQKAALLAVDEASRKLIQQYSTFGFEGASCIEFPADLLIAPPGYKEGKENARKSVQNVKTDKNQIDNGSNVTVADTKPIDSESNVTVADSKPIDNESNVTVADSKPIDNESNVTVADTKPIDNESNVTVADKKPIEEESNVTVADTKPIDNESNVTVADTKPIDNESSVAAIQNESAVTEADTKSKKHESTVANYADNLQALKNRLPPDQYDIMVRKKVESMLPSPPLELTENDSDFIPFYRYLKNVARNSKQGRKPLKPSSPIEEDLGLGEFFRETAYVQLFGIWRPFAVCIDGKVLRLCKENMRSQVDLEIQLDNCRIEPATNFSFRKLHLFKLIIYTDEYIFALDTLSTSLEWIAKIMKAALSIPDRKDLTLLRTGLGRDQFSTIEE